MIGGTVDERQVWSTERAVQRLNANNRESFTSSVHSLRSLLDCASIPRLKRVFITHFDRGI